jgi:hypothetical protein
MNSCSHSTIQKAASSQLFFSREKRRRIEVSCLSRQRICLRTDAERSTAARKFYTHLKKEESRNNGVRTGKVSGKAVCDRAPESRQNVDWQSANRANPLVTTPYLAINWQRGQINARFTWRDQRFPTPPQRRNSRQTGALVTTGHLFWQYPSRTTDAWLPISNPAALSARREAKGRGGVQTDAVAESAISISSSGKFYANASLTLF